MSAPGRALWPAWVRVALALLVLCLGCGKRSLEGSRVPDRAPLIRITCGAVLSTPEHPELVGYRVRFCWTAFDPDGTVDHYEYAMAAADTDSARASFRTVTRLTSAEVLYRADSAFAPRTDSARKVFAAARFQQFFLRAVDQEGLASPWEWRYFNAYTIAPRTYILAPLSGGGFGTVGTSFTLRWLGVDQDARDPQKRPVRYSIYSLDISGRPLPVSPADFDDIIHRTLRQVPLVVQGDTTSQFVRPVVGHSYCTIVKAMDEAGAEEPLPTTQSDLPGASRVVAANNSTLGLNTTFYLAIPTVNQPTLDVTAGSETRRFVGFVPTQVLRLQVPVGAVLALQWGGDASSYGSRIASYRFALDIDDPTADRPRVIRPNGFSWTPVDIRSTSFLLSSLRDPGLHSLYIQTFDESGVYTIASVEVEVIRATFDRPVLFILDAPGTVNGAANGPALTVDETLEYWRDVLETDRYYALEGEEASSRCRPVASADSFIVNLGTSTSGAGLASTRRNVPYSVLARYRVIVWDLPQTPVQNSGAPSLEFIMHQYVASQEFNNFFSYMQAGGRLWVFGGGGARWMCRGYPVQYPVSENRSASFGDFAFDVLGLRGGGVVLPTINSTVNLTSHPEKDFRLAAVNPVATGFRRLTWRGRETAHVPALTYDVARYDTMVTTRFDVSRQPIPYSGSTEVLSGLPAGAVGDPDSARWQPIALYRPRGLEATTVTTQIPSGFPLAGAVTGWYFRGDLLHLGGRSVTSNFETYFFGVDLTLLRREEVRQLADVLLSTRSWDMWRGGCPPVKSGGRPSAARP